jgi:hypothetical protein
MPVLLREIPNIKNFGATLEGLDYKVRELKMGNLRVRFINKIQAVLNLFEFAR